MTNSLKNKTTVCWNVDRVQSGKKTSFTQLEDHKILLDEIVGDTVDGIHDVVRGTAVNGKVLAGQHGGPQSP